MTEAVPSLTAPAVRPRPRLTVLIVSIALVLAALVVPSTPPAHASTPRFTAATLYTYARTMLGLLNRERHAHGKRSLSMAYRLRVSAHRHNLRMATTNVMSHQLPGEAFFATRITNAGYHWRAAGENIGWTNDLTVGGLLTLERVMYNERPPGDTGHRVNILSTNYTQVGIDVLYDARHHKIWFTQDFGAPAR